MNLDSLLYTYKEIGIVEKNGVKYKKLAKVPRIRTKHRAALSRIVFQSLLVALFGAVAFHGIRWFLERGGPPAADRPPSQFQGFN